MSTPSRPALRHRPTRDASALGMDAEAAVAVIQALRYPTDFDRSATSHHDPQPWHDSDKPALGRRTLYPKFTVEDEGRYLSTGPKEA